ncbi:hypothetical protein KEM56_003395 [Ascosphaera pollenicola]|nr:hypothetical protein KEM56_003395 [Ascosphaera pollenicola]
MDGEASNTAAHLAKAFQDLSRGEQTAASMESNLDDVESKIDQLLKALDHAGSGDGDDNDEEGTTDEVKTKK